MGMRTRCRGDAIILLLVALSLLVCAFLGGCEEKARVVEDKAFFVRYKVFVYHPTGKPWYEFTCKSEPGFVLNDTVQVTEKGVTHSFNGWCMHWYPVLVPIKPEVAPAPPRKTAEVPK